MLRSYGREAVGLAGCSEVCDVVVDGRGLVDDDGSDDAVDAETAGCSDDITNGDVVVVSVNQAIFELSSSSFIVDVVHSS